MFGNPYSVDSFKLTFPCRVVIVSENGFPWGEQSSAEEIENLSANGAFMQKAVIDKLLRKVKTLWERKMGRQAKRRICTGNGSFAVHNSAGRFLFLIANGRPGSFPADRLFAVGMPDSQSRNTCAGL